MAAAADDVQEAPGLLSHAVVGHQRGLPDPQAHPVAVVVVERQWPLQVERQLVVAAGRGAVGPMRLWSELPMPRRR